MPVIGPMGMLCQWTRDTGYHVILTESNVDECARAIAADPNLGLYLSGTHASLVIEPTLLHRFPTLRSVRLGNVGKAAIDTLYGAPQLEDVSLQDDSAPLDLSRLPQLRRLSMGWGDVFNNSLSSQRELRELYISTYRPRCRTLQPLLHLSKLERLELADTNIRTLDGITAFQNLRHFECHYARSLVDISKLSTLASTLTHLRLDNCPKLTQVEHLLHQLQQLTFLSLSSSGRLKTLAFINDMPNLRQLIFMDTLIEDGDITPCERLDYAGFESKRTYNRTFEAIEKIHISRPGSTLKSLKDRSKTTRHPRP